jgi:dipeptidyl-peptidase-4
MAAGGGVPEGHGPITLDRVATFPPPGTRIPTGFRFTRDGRYLYYLSYEGEGPERSLVREETESGRREVVGRPAAGGGEALSRDEILRRERRRIQDLGITEFVLAERSDVLVYTLQGGLYLVRAGVPAGRIEEAGAGTSDAALSPDGRRLSFVRDGALWVLDFETRGLHRLTPPAREGLSYGVAEYIAQEEMQRPRGAFLSEDGAALAVTEVDESAIPVYPIVHQGRAKWDVETSRYPFAGGPNARVRLGLVRATGGEIRWLDLRPGETPEDGGYLARVEFGPDNALYVQVQSRDQKRLRLLRFAPGTQDRSLLLEERSDTWVELHDDFKPLEDGRFLWSSERTGFRHLELRAADGSLVRALTSGSWPVDQLEGVDEKRGFVYFTAAKDGPLERPVYRVALAGGAVERLTPEPGWHTPRFSPDGRLFVDVHDSTTEPPRALLREASGRVRRRFESPEDPEVRTLGLRPPQFVEIQAADGTTLHGALYLPPDPGGGRHPALVRVYGGPTSQTVKNSWELTQDLRAQFLAQHGYVVFRLDNRGTPRRGVAFATALYHRLGSVEVEDQVAGARFLAGRHDVDGERIGIYGWSYGGYMSLMCLLQAPDVFRAAVAGAPVTDWDGYDTHYTERYMGTPQEDPDGYLRSSVLPLAERLSRPLLIIHGLSDENVHFRHTARLLNALNPAHKACDLLLFPDERHLPRAHADRVTLEDRLVEHFDAAFGVPAPK